MKKLTAEKCREEFEVWLSGVTGYARIFIKQYRCNESYADDFEHIDLWWAWKASREALEIALPVLEQQEKAAGQHQEGE